jgi:hypothetical protein
LSTSKGVATIQVRGGCGVRVCVCVCVCVCVLVYACVCVLVVGFAHYCVCSQNSKLTNCEVFLHGEQSLVGVTKTIMSAVSGDSLIQVLEAQESPREALTCCVRVCVQITSNQGLAQLDHVTADIVRINTNDGNVKATGVCAIVRCVATASLRVFAHPFFFVARGAVCNINSIFKAYTVSGMISVSNMTVALGGSVLVESDSGDISVDLSVCLCDFGVGEPGFSHIARLTS